VITGSIPAEAVLVVDSLTELVERIGTCWTGATAT
jgi:hypothetical protein